MCGRFTLRTSPQEVAEVFELPEPVQLTFRYNIAPTQTIAAVRQTEEGVRELAMLRWGLVPSWAKDPSIGSSLCNARADGIATKPAFRSGFKRRRCLIPADGFYEWQKRQDTPKQKQPYYITVEEGLFAFAGLWELWKGPDGPLESCTLITTGANELMAPIHDRMPVILPRALWAMWLDPSVQEPAALNEFLQPYPAERMRATPVSTLVNSSRNEHPDCIRPVEKPSRQQELFA
jgi:putative SOS response-associated peptidase YedK